MSGVFWLACSPTEETDDEEKPFQRRTDHWDIERTSGWAWRERAVPKAWDQRCHFLQMAVQVSDARRLKTLESENANLKKMLAEQMMDVATLKEMLGKNF